MSRPSRPAAAAATALLGAAALLVGLGGDAGAAAPLVGPTGAASRLVGDPASTFDPHPYAGLVYAVAQPRSGVDVARIWAQAEHVLSPHDPAAAPHQLVLSRQAMARLRAAGVPIDEQPIDVAALVAADRPAVLRDEARVPGRLGIFGPWFDQVRDLDAIYAYLDELVALSAGRASVIDIGRTVEGRPIRALRITGADGPTGASILVTGTQHAREWASTLVAMGIADGLVRRADVDVVRRLLSRLDVYVVPVVNADGYVASHHGLRLQRKNMNGSCSVNLNRNYDVAFGLGLSTDGCLAENYPGTGAFSEPETRAVRDLRAQLFDLRLYLDYHAPAEQVMVPFAYTRTRPVGYQESLRWAQLYADGVAQLYGTLHPARDAYDLAQGQGGGAIDWLRTEGVESFAIELRNGRELGGFQLPANQIVPTVEENWIAFLAVAAEAARTLDEDDGATEPAWPDLPTLVTSMTVAPAPVVGVSGCSVTPGGRRNQSGAGLWLTLAALSGLGFGARARNHRARRSN